MLQSKIMRALVAGAAAAALLATAGCTSSDKPAAKPKPQSYPALSDAAGVEAYLNKMFTLLSASVEGDYEHKSPSVEAGDGQTPCRDFVADSNDARGRAVDIAVGDNTTDPSSPAISLCNAVNLPYVVFAPNKFWEQYGSNKAAREAAVTSTYARFLWWRNKVVTPDTQAVEFVNVACYQGAITAGEIRAGRLPSSQKAASEDFIAQVLGSSALDIFKKGYGGGNCTKD